MSSFVPYYQQESFPASAYLSPDSSDSEVNLPTNGLELYTDLGHQRRLGPSYMHQSSEQWTPPKPPVDQWVNKKFNHSVYHPPTLPPWQRNISFLPAQPSEHAHPDTKLKGGMVWANENDQNFTSTGTTIGLQNSPAPQGQDCINKRPVNVNFLCEICGKGFVRKYTKRFHMQLHYSKNKKPHKCIAAGCDMKFARKADLSRHHKSVHQKLKDHKCNKCNSLFSRKDTLMG